MSGVGLVDRIEKKFAVMSSEKAESRFLSLVGLTNETEASAPRYAWESLPSLVEPALRMLGIRLYTFCCPRRTGLSHWGHYQRDVGQVSELPPNAACQTLAKQCSLRSQCRMSFSGHSRSLDCRLRPPGFLLSVAFITAWIETVAACWVASWVASWVRSLLQCWVPP